MDIRQIIHEEIQTLFGKPIPNKGDRDFIPDIHDLETVYMKASNLGIELKKFKLFIHELGLIVSSSHLSTEERFNQIQNLYIDFIENS